VIIVLTLEEFLLAPGIIAMPRMSGYLANQLASAIEEWLKSKEGREWLKSLGYVKAEYKELHKDYREAKEYFDRHWKRFKKKKVVTAHPTKRHLHITTDTNKILVDNVKSVAIIEEE